MSVQAIGQVLNLPLNDVSAKAVLVGLANHTSPDGECFPSVRRLMLYSGLSERAVRDTIKKLEGLGLIRVERQPGRRSVYHLQLDTPAPDAGVVVQDVQGTPAAAAPHNHKEPSNKSSDARAGLADDWKPAKKTREQIDKAYPSIDIDEQIRLFVLHNQAAGTVLANPEAAFIKWMVRTASLKMPVKGRPSLAPVAGGPVDPATYARRLETVADRAYRTGNPDEAAEHWLAAAGQWMRAEGEQGSNVLRCVERALKDARKHSWHWEQAMLFMERINGSSKSEADTGQRDPAGPASG